MSTEAELVRQTPLVRAPFIGKNVWLKLESLQRTGSFKLRGAMAACASLSASERAAGIVVASAGNHGAGMALAARVTGSRLLVVVPSYAPETKRAKIAKAGADVQVFDGDYDQAEAFARELAAAEGRVFISAFDDERVISGNGDSLAREIHDQAPAVACIVAPVGGGGMIAGIGRTLAPSGVRIVGAQPRVNCAFHGSLAAGRALTDYVGEHTVAEGCEGAVGALAFATAREHVERVVLVSEDEIEEAVRVTYRKMGLVLECTGAVGVAALHFGLVPRGDEQVVCVVSGGNIDEDELDRILCQRPRV